MREKYIKIGEETVSLKYTLRAMDRITNLLDGDINKLPEYLSESNKIESIGDELHKNRICLIFSILSNYKKTSADFYIAFSLENKPFPQHVIFEVINHGLKFTIPDDVELKDEDIDIELEELKRLRKAKNPQKELPDVFYLRMVANALQIGIDYKSAHDLTPGEIIQMKMFFMPKKSDKSGA